MQNAYAFDVGDFGKFGLLRHLAGVHEGPLLKTGIVWYACSRLSNAADGKHRTYLELASSPAVGRGTELYRGCDPELFDGFRSALLREGTFTHPTLSIANLEAWTGLPNDTVYVSDQTPASSAREAWMDLVLQRLQRCEIVFCDPDNGIAGMGSALERSKSPKHILLQELQALFAAGGHSVIVYHHLCRQGSHDLQIYRLRRRIADSIPDAAKVLAVRYRRGTSRAFFILCQQRHSSLLEGRLAAFLAGPFGKQHFEGATS